MTRDKYSKYTRQHAKLRKFLEQAQPTYKKLVRFTNLCIQQDESSTPKIQVIEWDIPYLIQAHRSMSKYLHFHRISDETWEDNTWLSEFKQTLENIASYLWNEMIKNGTGIMDEDTMQPEVLKMWKLFRDGQLSEEECVLRLKLAGPIFRKRQALKDSIIQEYL